MKTFILLFREGFPYLRQKNPLFGSRLISDAAYREHEALYIDSALVFISPLTGRSEYKEDELDIIWQFNEDTDWTDVAEPNFVGTDTGQYRQVFRVRSAAKFSFQEDAAFWAQQTFGESVMTDIPERCFRFIEEAVELAQAFGVSKEDVLRHVTRTYGRPQGEIAQEVGGTLVTLAVLCQAANLDLQDCGEKELANNWKRKDAIREKWLQKTVVMP